MKNKPINLLQKTHKTLNWIILATIILSIGFGQFTKVTLPPIPSFHLHDPLVLLYLTLNFKSLFSNKYNSLARPLYLFFFSLLIYFLLNLNLTMQSPLNSLYLLRTGAYLVFFLTILNIKNLNKKTRSQITKLKGKKLRLDLLTWCKLQLQNSSLTLNFTTQTLCPREEPSLLVKPSYQEILCCLKPRKQFPTIKPYIEKKLLVTLKKTFSRFLKTSHIH